MALEEYRRKRDFKATPEPAPKLDPKKGFRFVVQKHRASHLHYDFRLEMEGVLKSWAVPKGPSLDPADKRLAMMVEDHPVSYFHFEGIIPTGNYGAGTVEVWDTGTWQPLLPAGKPGRPEMERAASEGLAKGDFKFRLNGQKLRGEFVLVKTRSRRPGSKGNEWLLIKHRDDYVEPEYDIEAQDGSVLSGRTLDEIAVDEGSAEWQSNRKAARGKKDWLSKSIAVHDKRRREQGVKGEAPRPRKTAAKKNFKASTETTSDKEGHTAWQLSPRARPSAKTAKLPEDVSNLRGVQKAGMPHSIRPMLATLVDEPFESKQWLYELKFDGYRAVAFINNGSVRLISRNQNEFTHAYPELAVVADAVQGHRVVLDGEICALDEQGRSSFSLMQQRTGLSGEGGKKIRNSRPDIPIVYYVFDLLYLDGYSLLRVNLDERKRVLREVLRDTQLVRYSDHFDDGLALYKAAKQRHLEGIVAKKRNSCYVEKRSREWLKVKITQTAECVIGGYTDPKGTREHFGSIVLGQYDDRGRLIHVGQAGSGFTDRSHAEMWKKLHAIETKNNPFATKVESTRRTHWVEPKLVAQIKFTEWTHEGESGGVKMRAPVFLGLREDKRPEECRFEEARSTKREVDAA